MASVISICSDLKKNLTPKNDIQKPKPDKDCSFNYAHLSRLALGMHFLTLYI